jgi:selenocysteine-specific elongation factor
MESDAPTHLILGTAGHIDHGKSALIKALTGTDPDRLEEEKRRGITIELGFAQLELSEKLSIGVVDVPGHERFVRQMIAGATGIDIALLCIAADDGIMPQTVEHLAVLELLAIPRCVVAITKTDLVDDEWLALIVEDIRAFLGGTPYEGAPLVPLSSKTGAGLAALRQVLLTTAETTRRQRFGVNVRLPIDRVFTIKGHGTVVTGTLWSGAISPDDELEILPSRLRARVRTVQIHGHTVQKADAGNRVALNLNALKKGDPRPGDFLASPRGITPTDRFDAWLTYLGAIREAKPLRSGVRIRIAHGTREVMGRVLFMDAQASLAPRQAAFAQIRLESPLPLSWHDRFIMRANSPLRVIGGGIVLSCHPRRRTNLTASERAYLDALLRGDEREICTVAFETRDAPLSARELAEHTGVDVDQAEQCLKALSETGEALPLSHDLKTARYTTRRVLQKCLAVMENKLLAFHAKNLQLTGISKNAFENLCDLKIPSESFAALLAEAQHLKKLVVSSGEVSHPQAGSGAKQIASETGERLYSLLTSAGATPPSVEELIAQCGLGQTLVYRALKALEQQGRIRYVSREFYFPVETLTGIEAAVRAYLQTHGQATVAELKDAMRVSRKYAVPLLEYFDAAHVTKRNGDLRGLAE